MSQENVEMVRDLAEAFQRGNIERAYDFYDPDIEWDASRFVGVIPDLTGIYHGHDAIRDFWQRWLEAWRDLRFEFEDIGMLTTTLSSSSGINANGDGAQASKPTLSRTRGCSPLGATGSCALRSTRHMTKPSKLPGFRSRAEPSREILRGRCRQRSDG